MKNLCPLVRFAAFSAVLLAGTLNSNAQYCTTNLYLTGCIDDDYIQSFRTTGGLTNITNYLTGCSNTTTAAYTYYSAHTHTTSVGNSVNYSLVNGPVYAENYYLFVDWNADGDFTDAGETIASGAVAIGDSVTGSFPVPAGTSLGTKRMRARVVYNPSSTVTACSQANYGEVEDYNLVVTTPCDPPSSATISNIASTSADMTWPAVSGAMGYDWDVTTSPTPPTMGAYNSTTTTASIATLSPATIYYFHLRTQCAAGYYSTWVTQTFTTLPPCAPPTMTIDDITTNSIKISWTPVSNAVNYEYSVLTTTPPPPSGTSTTALSATISSLNGATKYYVRLRSVCGASSYSTWQFKQAFTHYPTSVDEFNEGSLHIYPTPASDVLTIESPEHQGNAIVQLTDVSGRMVMEQETNTPTTTLNISKLQPGVYILKHMQGSAVSIHQIVKQ
ncbi:GEVED domain-containing protein [Polluticoccus soli]|uniref:GEVED domain-containing protein n=1 Tax=Polluticoccus soli TaxID=3034150 RepID=UPI0023E2DF98|nr:GEVED domain-containing protein [Flavipsychrobacter sp. JY13-12]